MRVEGLSRSHNKPNERAGQSVAKIANTEARASASGKRSSEPGTARALGLIGPVDFAGAARGFRVHPAQVVAHDGLADQIVAAPTPPDLVELLQLEVGQLETDRIFHVPRPFRVFVGGPRP